MSVCVCVCVCVLEVVFTHAIYGKSGQKFSWIFTWEFVYNGEFFCKANPFFFWTNLLQRNGSLVTIDFPYNTPQV